MSAALIDDIDGSVIRLGGNKGLEVELLPLGATIRSIRLFGQELTLNYPDVAQYQTDEFYLGATAGRVANRIAKGRFELNGVAYQLDCNNGPNHLHGGVTGFNRQQWQVLKQQPDSVQLYLRSADGDQGYPGAVQVWQQFRIVDKQLELSFLALSTKDTLLNLTNHCYFNLNSDGSSVENHQLQLSATHYLPTDASAIPTGERRAVAGTAFDFTKAKLVGPALRQQDQQLALANGFDHCFIWQDSDAAELKSMAVLSSSQSGRQLEVLSTQPGLQLYTGNFLAAPFTARQGICLEAQGWPDAVNQLGFPGTQLKAGELYQQQIVYKFS
ncbi:galactose mutarotase-like enzyme [Rheinheimera sp. A13L]|uniref:aldose epimerase family protein n=1 Tax=Rheinheimera sp. A13L TaxID=506534 RepID=UPI00021252B7|nr:aldose epimerase family protein [Rheinheimera sp. A13L]EGM79095.1 galactose mutarotase-like enzyme [Rheinheimera sp. A13L]